MENNNLDVIENALKELCLKNEKKYDVPSFDRESNNNAVIIVPNSNDSNFRLMGVANDLQDGSISSNVVNELGNWFTFLKEEYKNDVENLEKVYIDELKNIKDYFNNNSSSVLPSFAGVIVGSKQTVIVRIRDTAIYCYNDGKIEAFSEEGYKRESLTDDLHIESKIVNNSDYITLILLSNGEYGNIIDDEVKIITKDTDRDAIARELLESSI